MHHTAAPAAIIPSGSSLANAPDLTVVPVTRYVDLTLVQPTSPSGPEANEEFLDAYRTKLIEQITAYVRHLPDLTEQPDRFLEVRSLRTTEAPYPSPSKYFSIRELKAKPEKLADYILGKITNGVHKYEEFWISRSTFFAKRRPAATEACAESCLAFVGDYDGTDDLSGILADLSNQGIPEPSMVVRSGGGYHLYWWLRSPIPALLARPAHEAFVRSIGHESIDHSSAQMFRPFRIPGTPNFEEWAFCEIIHQDPRLTYYVHELAPKHRIILDDDVEEMVLTEAREEYETIETIRKERNASWTGLRPGAYRPDRGPGVLPLKEETSGDTPTPALPASTTPIPTYCTVPHFGEDPPEWVDWEHIEAIIESTGPRNLGGDRRNKALARLVARLRKSTWPSRGQLESIHARWFLRWRSLFSSRHSESYSLKQFLHCWDQMPEQYRTQDDYLKKLLNDFEDHPLAHLLGTTGHQAAGRAVASLIYTGCKRGKHWRCYLGERGIARALGISDSAVNRWVRRALEIGIVSIARDDDGVPLKGSKETGLATVYEIPEKARR